MKTKNQDLVKVVKNLAGVLTKSSAHNSCHNDVIDVTYLLWKLSSALEIKESVLRDLKVRQLLDLSSDLNNHIFDKK